MPLVVSTVTGSARFSVTWTVCPAPTVPVDGEVLSGLNVPTWFIAAATCEAKLLPVKLLTVLLSAAALPTDEAICCAALPCVAMLTAVTLTSRVVGSVVEATCCWTAELLALATAAVAAAVVGSTPALVAMVVSVV